MQNQVENITNLIGLINNIQMRWEYLSGEIHKADKKQQDLLHEIENGKFNTVQGYFKLMELKELRQYRRDIKNEQEIMIPYYTWWKEHQKITLDLCKIKGSMEKSVISKANWKYASRETGEVMEGAI